MQIFVLRHGQAEPQLTSDAARNLTLTGRVQVAASIQGALTELASIQEIWASPLVRAQQTADIARELLEAQGARLVMRTSRLITPESQPADLLNALVSAEVNSLLLVTHQPFAGSFIDICCGSPRGFHALDTSSLALIDCAMLGPGCGELRWLRHVYEG
jgi:phosphohistidine phosphatase